MKPWKELESENVLQNKWITVEKRKYDLQNGVKIDDYYIVSKKDFVVIIVLERDKIYFLQQYRPGIKATILNLPMGIIDGGDTPEETAKRELLEELGVVAELELLGDFYLAPSYITTRAYVFFTKTITKKFEPKGDQHEGKMEIVRVTPQECKTMLTTNKLKDMATITALQMASERLGMC